MPWWYYQGGLTVCLLVFLNLAVGETMQAGQRGCFICLPTLNFLHLLKTSAFRFAGTEGKDLVLPEVRVKPSDFQPLWIQLVSR